MPKRPIIPSHPREPYTFLQNRLTEAKVQESLGGATVAVGTLIPGADGTVIKTVAGLATWAFLTGADIGPGVFGAGTGFRFPTELVIGTDPGGAEVFRVGGNIALPTGQYITFGGLGTSYMQVEGTPRFVWSVGGATRMRLETVSLNPTSSGGLTLGTAALPWGNAFLGTTVIGTDPGGGNNFRVGGTARFQGAPSPLMQFRTTSVGDIAWFASNTAPAASDPAFIIRQNSVRTRIELVTYDGTIVPIFVRFDAASTIAASVLTLALGGMALVVGTDPGGTALFRVGGDVRVGSLGVMDSSIAPGADQLLSFDSSVSKWRPRTVQLSFNSGVMVASALGDGSQWVGANSNPSLSGTPSAPVAAPVVTPVYGGFIIDMSATALPANTVYVLDYSKNGGAYTSGAIICTSGKVVHQIIQNNTSGGAGTSSDTFAYKFKLRGGSDSAYSAAAGAQSFSTKTEVNAFGLIAASQIAAVNLAAVVADLGVITAGRIQNAGNTAGIRVSTGYTLPGWTNYIDLTATGSNFFLKTPNFSVDGNGNVVISGTLSTQAGTSGTFAKVGGVIYTTSVGVLTKNATSSGNLWSTTLKGNTLVSVGSSVKVQQRGTMTVSLGSVTLTWTLTLKLGGTTIATFSKTFNGSADAPFVFDAIITKKASNSQGTTSYDIGWNGTVQSVDTALTDTADQTLSCDYSFTTNAAISSSLTMKNVVAEWSQS